MLQVGAKRKKKKNTGIVSSNTAQLLNIYMPLYTLFCVAYGDVQITGNDSDKSKLLSQRNALNSGDVIPLISVSFPSPLDEQEV
jgi:hypothetical protein